MGHNPGQDCSSPQPPPMPALLLLRQRHAAPGSARPALPTWRAGFWGRVQGWRLPALRPWLRVMGLVFAASLPAQAQPQPQLDLPRTTLGAGMFLIQAQVAQTAEQRATGLMHRREMPPNEGMLFIFERPSIQCFWMKNTLLPLTAAFVADDGTIVNLADMQPQSLDSHCSTKPVRFVLEMHQGWFVRKGIKAGSRLSGAPFETRPAQ